MGTRELIVSILDSFNLKLIRKPDYRNDVRFIPKSFVDVVEVRELHQLFKRFVSNHKDDGVSGLSLKELRTYMSRRRMSRQKDFVDFILSSQDSLSGKKVLDVGCGMGYLLNRIDLQVSDSSLTGVDPSLKTKLIAPHVCPNAKFRNTPLNNEVSECADIIIAAQVLEHLENPAEFCEILKANAASRASYYFSVPDGRLDSLPAGHFFEGNGSYTGHINFWSPESLKILLESIFENHEVDVGISEWGDLFASILPCS